MKLIQVDKFAGVQTYKYVINGDIYHFNYIPKTGLLSVYKECILLRSYYNIADYTVYTEEEWFQYSLVDDLLLYIKEWLPEAFNETF